MTMRNDNELLAMINKQLEESVKNKKRLEIKMFCLELAMFGLALGFVTAFLYII